MKQILFSIVVIIASIIIANAQIASVNYKIKLLEKLDFNKLLSCEIVFNEEDSMNARHVVILNKDSTQYLIAYQMYGSAEGKYSAFEIGFTDPVIMNKQFVVSRYKVFQVRHCKLGEPAKKLLNKKRHSHGIFINNKDDSYEFVYTGKRLNKYNMPKYTEIYYCNNNQISKIIIGFPYL